jgi:AraC-like DNA-binding protein
VEQHPKGSLFLSLIVQGQAVHYGPDKIAVLHPGEFIVYDPDHPYLMAFTNGTSQFFLDVPRGVLQRHGLRPTTNGAEKFDTVRQAASGVTASDLTQIFRVLNDPTFDLHGLNAKIVHALKSLDMAATCQATSPHVERALYFIRQHGLKPELTVDDIAAAVGISSRHLSREFTDLGKTPMQYVLEKRLDAAKELLALSSMSITRIAQECGFHSPTSFSRAFLSKVGQTPRSFRKAAGNSSGGRTSDTHAEVGDSGTSEGPVRVSTVPQGAGPCRARQPAVVHPVRPARDGPA